MITFVTYQGSPHIVLASQPKKRINFSKACVENEFCINAVSRKLGVPVEQLRKAFRDYAGISPKKWMIQNRIICAVRALREGKAMPEVIAEFGYYDQPHLGKDFKAVLGESPRALRDRVLNLQKVLPY